MIQGGWPRAWHAGDQTLPALWVGSGTIRGLSIPQAGDGRAGHGPGQAPELADEPSLEEGGSCSSPLTYFSSLNHSPHWKEGGRGGAAILLSYHLARWHC